MIAAVAFGGAILGAATLLARGVTLASEAEVLALLGRAPRVRGARRAGRVAARAERLGWPFDARAYGSALVASAVLVGLVSWRLAGPVGGVAGALGAPLGIERWLRRRSERRRGSLELEVRDAVEALAAAARSGLTLRQSLNEASREAGPGLHGALREAVSRVDAGEPPVGAVTKLADDLGSRDVRLLAVVLRMHQRTGGDLAALLDELSAVIGRRVEDRRRLRALTAQGRASGAVLAVLPVAFVGLLSGTSGNGLGAFYATPLGGALLAGGIALEALGFLWIRRIMRDG